MCGFESELKKKSKLNEFVRSFGCRLKRSISFAILMVNGRVAFTFLFRIHKLNYSFCRYGTQKKKYNRFGTPNYDRKIDCVECIEQCFRRTEENSTHNNISWKYRFNFLQFERRSNKSGLAAYIFRTIFFLLFCGQQEEQFLQIIMRQTKNTISIFLSTTHIAHRTSHIALVFNCTFYNYINFIWCASRVWPCGCVPKEYINKN